MLPKRDFFLMEKFKICMILKTCQCDLICEILLDQNNMIAKSRFFCYGTTICFALPFENPICDK